MRAAIWFLALFGMAVATALFAGNNQGTITLFWPPYRVDMSFNLVVLLLALLFFVMHVALRGLSALFAIPGHARSWRIQNQERSIYVSLLDALSHMVAGRFIRARKAVELVLVRESAMKRNGETLVYSARLRALSHLLGAESAQALQDAQGREDHFRLAMEQSTQRDALEIREGLQLRAARWAIEDRDAQSALKCLDELPQGVARRTIALRLRLKAARLGHQTGVALETARLLNKHRAFSEVAAQGLIRGLALEWVTSAYDPDQLQTIWNQLDVTERMMPEVAMQACSQMLYLRGDVAVAHGWILPIWDGMVEQPQTLTDSQRVQLVKVLESGFNLASSAPESLWLARIEKAQMTNPGDSILLYLAGITCRRLQLWGKAQQLLKQSLPRLQDVALQRSAWLALAELAEQQGDGAAAAQAWKSAAKVK